MTLTRWIRRLLRPTPVKAPAPISMDDLILALGGEGL